jgi:hypothetical protein
MKVEDARRMKELEKENARLKGLVAEQVSDLSILREVNIKNFSYRAGQPMGERQYRKLQRSHAS